MKVLCIYDAQKHWESWDMMYKSLLDITTAIHTKH